jgi:O-antigen/teichoic acid export membrane protein
MNNDKYKMWNRVGFSLLLTMIFFLFILFVPDTSDDPMFKIDILRPTKLYVTIGVTTIIGIVFMCLSSKKDTK